MNVELTIRLIVFVAAIIIGEWIKGVGYRKNKNMLRAYLSLSNYHFYFLVLIFVIPPKYAKGLLGLILLGVFVYGVMLDWFIYREVLKANSLFVEYMKDKELKIVVRESISFIRPKNVWFKLADYYIQFFLQSMQFPVNSIITCEQNYVFIMGVIALNNKELLSDKGYYMSSAYHIIKRQKKNGGIHESLRKNCKYMILFVNDFDEYEESRSLCTGLDENRMDYYEVSKLVDGSVNKSFISIIENDRHNGKKLKEKFHKYMNYDTNDLGKNEVKKMLRNLMEIPRDSTYTFYCLIKIGEFIIHYQSLAYYEEMSCNYFSNRKRVSMGTFLSGVKSSNAIAINKELDSSFKFLNHIMTGKEGRISKRNPLIDICKKLVEIRNRFVGHGTMAYSVSPQIIERLLVILEFVIEDFMTKDMEKINDLLEEKIDKFKMVEGNICLLSYWSEEENFEYTDYETGNIVMYGALQKLMLDRR